MKIAYLCSSILPSRTANSVHVMRMCAAYAALGHEVVLFAPDRGREAEAGAGDLFAYYGAPRAFEVRRLPWPAIRLRSQWYAWKLRGALREFAPDFVHSRFLPGSAWAGRGKAVSVFEAHAPVGGESRWHAALLARLIRRDAVRGLVVISRALARRTLEDGLAAGDRLLVAPDGADIPPAGLAAHAYAGAPGRLQAGYVGQLYQGKGMEVLERLAPMVPEADFHVIGGSERDLAHWKGRIAFPNVTFHGFVPPARAAAYVAGLDVCLLPNQRVVRTFTARRRDQGDIGAYTSPLKLFEYMAHGKAILASRLPVLEEILDGSLAMLADPEDMGEWQAGLRRLADPELRRKLGGAAKAAFLAGYSWEARARNILAFADRLADGGRLPPARDGVLRPAPEGAR